MCQSVGRRRSTRLRRQSTATESLGSFLFSCSLLSEKDVEGPIWGHCRTALHINTTAEGTFGDWRDSRSEMGCEMGLHCSLGYSALACFGEPERAAWYSQRRRGQPTTPATFVIVSCIRFLRK